jgi:hypothetical protein
MVSLQKQEENIRQKMEIKAQKEKELENLKDTNLNFKQNIQDTIESKRAEKMRQLKEEAQLLKEQRKNNAELIKYIKIEEFNNNKNKYEFIKAQQILSEEKKRAMDVKV